jgi:hypothetical protein
MYDSSARLIPYAIVADRTPTPEANEEVFSPGCTPRMKFRALKIGAGEKISGNAL